MSFNSIKSIKMDFLFKIGAHSILKFNKYTILTNFGGYLLLKRKFWYITNLLKAHMLWFKALLFVKTVIQSNAQFLFLFKSRAMWPVVKRLVKNTNQSLIFQNDYIPGTFSNYVSSR